MQIELTPEDVKLYLVAIFGAEPVPDADGTVHLRCVFPFEPPHEIHMKIQTGRWVCQSGHGRGELDDFESGRSRLFGLHSGEMAILRIIAEAKKRRLEAEEARRAAQERQIADLPPRWRSLRGIVGRHPKGTLRRYLQQQSHLHRLEFRKAVKELARRGLIRQEFARHRPRPKPKAIYFPVEPAIASLPNPRADGDALPSRCLG